MPALADLPSDTLEHLKTVVAFLFRQLKKEPPRGVKMQ